MRALAVASGLRLRRPSRAGASGLRLRRPSQAAACRVSVITSICLVGRAVLDHDPYGLRIIAAADTTCSIPMSPRVLIATSCSGQSCHAAVPPQPVQCRVCR